MTGWTKYLKTREGQDDEAAWVIGVLLQIVSGLCWLGAVVDVLWFYRSDVPGWLQSSLFVHHVLLGPSQPPSGVATAVHVVGLCLEGAIYDQIGRLAARCGKSAVFTRVNVVTLQWVGWLSVARQIVETKGFSGLHWLLGLPAMAAPDTGPVLGSLAATTLPFVIAWVFQRGVNIQEELDDVV